MPSQQEIFDQVRSILVEVFGVDPNKVTPEANLQNDLRLDSLGIIEFIVEIEDGFGIQIPDDQIDRFQTVGNAVNVIQDLQLLGLAQSTYAPLVGNMGALDALTESDSNSEERRRRKEIRKRLRPIAGRPVEQKEGTLAILSDSKKIRRSDIELFYEYTESAGDYTEIYAVIDADTTEDLSPFGATSITGPRGIPLGGFLLP
jgi:acyl carrier protein